MSNDKVEATFHGAERTYVIHKYEIPIDSNWHPAPGMARLVLLDAAGERSVTAWFEVELENGEPVSYAPRAVRVFGTGHPIPGNATHLGSLVHRGNGGVWHLYLS